jgi:choline dehydrogenase-like flavoprotein
MESFQSQGLTYNPDMFSTGDSPHGCGHVPRTVYKGDRTTAANYLLNKSSNLAIKTDTTVDKVIIEGEGSDLRATGVKIIEKDGTMREIKAKKEVIVSGGAYCSPTILMRSGIGGNSELAAHGIDCKVDLPGVGKNLMDHVVRLYFSPWNYILTSGSRSLSSSTQPQNPTSQTTISSTNQTLSVKPTDNGKKKSAVHSQHFPSAPSPLLVSTNA